MVCNVMRIHTHIKEVKDIAQNEIYTKVILLIMKEIYWRRERLINCRTSGYLRRKSNLKSLSHTVHQQKEIPYILGLAVNNKAQNILKYIKIAIINIENQYEGVLLKACTK